MAEDYLDRWVSSGLEFFKKENLTQEDLLIATSVGEIGTLKLASILKSSIIVNILLIYMIL